MNRDRQNSADNEQDPLDELLAAAEWPQPDAGSLARLERYWQGVSPARARTRALRVAACLAVAAALTAALLVGWLLPRPVEPPGPVAPAPETLAGGPTERPAPDPATPVPEAPAPQPKPPAVGRAATPYEALLLQARSGRRQPALDAPPQDPVDQAIERRLDERDVALGTLTEPLMADRLNHEQTLLWQIQQSSGPRRVAAIELLGHLGSPRSVPLLIELSRGGDSHAAAVRALGRLADAEAVGELAAAERDAELQLELLATLLARGDRPSVAAYLACVLDRATSEAALTALDGADVVPVEQLFEFFNSLRQGERFAAAVVLGRLDDPEIPNRLVRMVAHNTRRREALVALVASSDDQAVHFVSLAGQDPVLKGSVSEARFRVQSMIP